MPVTVIRHVAASTVAGSARITSLQVRAPWKRQPVQQFAGQIDLVGTVGRAGNPGQGVTCGLGARGPSRKFPVSVRPVLEGPGSHRRFLRLPSAGRLMASVSPVRAH